MGRIRNQKKRKGKKREEGGNEGKEEGKEKGVGKHCNYNPNIILETCNILNI